MHKKPFSKKPKKAFSLIELSIVLIIIGLLVAGVTGGASLIQSATLRSVMNEVRGYRTSVNAFVDRYTAFPGDYTTAINGSGVGNGDQKIIFATALSGATSALFESNVAWNQLVFSGIIPSGNGVVTDTAAASLSANVGAVSPAVGPKTVGSGAMPASKYKAAGYIFDYLESGTTTAMNTIILTGTMSAGTAAPAAAASAIPALNNIVTGSDALSLDVKIDDGKGDSGNVRNAVLNTANVYTATAYSPSTTANTSVAFSIEVGNS